MADIFYRGDFDIFKVRNLNQYNRPVKKRIIAFDSKHSRTNTKVFISHKHDDLNDLAGIIGLLEKLFHVEIYIDSRDESMPEQTCGKTAALIKENIKNCDKFILLATDKAIESKWCNWELGFGDAIKYKEGQIAIFPLGNSPGEQYKGNEYMQIYPYIVYRDGTTYYKSGERITKGYYVKNQQTIMPLAKWIEK